MSVCVECEPRARKLVPPTPCGLRAALTRPDTEADSQRQVGRAAVQGAQREHSHVPAVHAHGGQGGARGLHRDLGGTGAQRVAPCLVWTFPCLRPPCGSPTAQPLEYRQDLSREGLQGPQVEGAGEEGMSERSPGWWGRAESLGVG